MFVETKKTPNKMMTSKHVHNKIDIKFSVHGTFLE